MPIIYLIYRIFLILTILHNCQKPIFFCFLSSQSYEKFGTNINDNSVPSTTSPSYSANYSQGTPNAPIGRSGTIYHDPISATPSSQAFYDTIPKSDSPNTQGTTSPQTFHDPRPETPRSRSSSVNDPRSNQSGRSLSRASYASVISQSSEGSDQTLHSPTGSVDNLAHTGH